MVTKENFIVKINLCCDFLTTAKSFSSPIEYRRKNRKDQSFDGTFAVRLVLLISNQSFKATRQRFHMSH